VPKQERRFHSPARHLKRTPSPPISVFCFVSPSYHITFTHIHSFWHPTFGIITQHFWLNHKLSYTIIIRINTFIMSLSTTLSEPAASTAGLIDAFGASASDNPILVAAAAPVDCDDADDLMDSVRDITKRSA
jgi:hypothetical protein